MLAVLGVRHHSPACARLVRHVIRTVRPRHVLVEGPADLNGRLDELRLPHVPPIAVFTWYQDEDRHHASWTPFCAYSPEWVAWREAEAVGATFRFVDLPAWHPAFAGVENRYADPAQHHARRYEDRLCERLGLDDRDALWDHLFEQPADPDVLRERLDRYFLHLRDGAAGGDRDGPREAFMRRWIGWALAQGGDVIVVCGGWHQPALLDVAPAPGDPPEVDAPSPGSKHGSWLVPYTYRRLDAFAGYQSGMPSPGFYDGVWERGPEAAAHDLLRTVAARLRARKQPVSTADLVATRAMAGALARLRGHEVLARTDVLDAIAGALVKDALEVPLPWARRGTLLPRTDPLLVEVVSALSGDREGKLAPGTPRPPLVHDVEHRLHAASLTPTRAGAVHRLSLPEPRDRARSRLLHQLRVLGIPGFRRTAGPAWGTDAELVEVWEVTRHPGAEVATIEAAAWGATLERAVGAKLEDALRGASGLGELARILGDAVFVGIDALATTALDAIAGRVGQAGDLGALGEAMGQLHALWRHGDLFEAAGAAPLAGALVAMFDRALWLVEGLQGPDAPADDAHLRALVAVRDTLRPGPRALDVSLPRALDVMRRRAHDPQAPPALRGAGLGFGWSVAGAPDEKARESAAHAIRSAATPTRFGDWLAGLFALAREEVTSAPELVAVLDEVIGGFGRDDFLVALPSLRMAFAWFPPRERERLAEQVLARHGRDPRGAWSLLRLETGPAVVMRGMALEQQVDEVMRRFALDGAP